MRARTSLDAWQRGVLERRGGRPANTTCNTKKPEITLRWDGHLALIKVGTILRLRAAHAS